MRGKRTCGGRPGQHVQEQGTWASRTRKHSEAGYGRPVDRGAWTAKTVKRPRQQPAHPQYANYWVPLTHKWHIIPHSAQPQHTNYWALRTRKQQQQEHRPQQPTESNPTQHAKGRTGDHPGPRRSATTRRNVTQGAGSPPHPPLLKGAPPPPPLPPSWTTGHPCRHNRRDRGHVRHRREPDVHDVAAQQRGRPRVLQAAVGGVPPRRARRLAPRQRDVLVPPVPRRHVQSHQDEPPDGRGRL